MTLQKIARHARHLSGTTAIMLFCICCGTETARAQDEYRIGALPSLSYKQALSPNLGLKGAVETRHFVTEGHFGAEDVKTAYTFSRVDASLLLSGKYDNHNKLNGGYLLRVKGGGEVVHRMMEQFEVVGKYPSVSMAHRFAAEQMYGEDSKPDYRFRYRISFKWPLARSGADEQTVAISAKNEHLYNFQAGEQGYEMRLGSGIGITFPNGNSFSLGPEYRVSPLNAPEKSHQFLLAVAFGVSG